MHAMPCMSNDVMIMHGGLCMSRVRSLISKHIKYVIVFYSSVNLQAVISETGLTWWNTVSSWRARHTGSGRRTTTAAQVLASNTRWSRAGRTGRESCRQASFQPANIESNGLNSRVSSTTGPMTRYSTNLFCSDKAHCVDHAIAWCTSTLKHTQVLQATNVCLVKNDILMLHKFLILQHKQLPLK